MTSTGRLLCPPWLPAALPQLPSLQRLYAALPFAQSNEVGGAASPLHQHVRAGAQQQPSAQRLRALDLDSIPMLKVEQACKTPQHTQELSWQDALQRVEAQPAQGEMLTDSFKCALERR